MLIYHKILLIYIVMGLICTCITWFVTKETRAIRLLASLLIGATWPFSFPVAMIFSLI
ncbi:GhoT/OrtT family toxin [Martelella alba]|uniref:GhoT/OrtT family toxin n=1 Tax=Martelella alba TaxID=2590451 RepID=A0ABY2SFQ5_9HYPH|nr:GhoT/OrtT family toxin [Martelella alba]